ncbi:MAG: type I 3-dehydroquinate dehydratase, partial [Planctomycetota bacterium]
DFEARPTDLFTRLAAMREVEAAKVLKVAYRARSLRDNLDLFDVLGERDRPTIALGMGEFGLMSRVLAPKFSGFLTFASIRDTSATAPGQPTVSDLLGLYRFRSITPATRVYGVIGWPVGHSISPQVHNAAFEAMDEDAVYLPLPIVPEYEPFKATVLALLDHAALGFTGASVTIPHKLHLVRLASEDTSRRWVVDEVASRVGAANTLAVDADGTCRVLNTDVAAAVEPLAEAMGGVADRRIAVLGAGGVGQAIAAGLADAGAHVTMHNRTMDKAAAALRKINSEHRLNSSPTGTIDIAPLESAGRSGCDAFVNCTALGMRGSAERETASPLSDLDFDALRGDEVVFDTVYTPRETPFLKSAAAKGLLTIRGETMFIRQALGQLAAWTGKTPPRGLVEKVAVEALERA